MGIMVFSVLWVVQDLYHQPYYKASAIDYTFWILRTVKQAEYWPLVDVGLLFCLLSG